ncbi:ATP synthase subunit delta, mitochondrial-like [Gigantopelta aegis]|uniref:ATP synthase subunit delta, mitochondrial-like n=1 Tax=Gigantopelta aegis TaxID=1735272 RepID=UPI001B88D67F|nr:ATP synthase subunit delta, mitochondrial-like [Gigantopelta aegis]
MLLLSRQVSRGCGMLKQCIRLTQAQSISHRNYADMAFTFATPSDVYYTNAKVKQVDVPSFSGSFGILPEHVPSLAVLKPGVVTVYEEDGTPKKYFVSSGSVTINDDSSVQVLAEEAHPLDRFDAHAIRDGIAKAQQEMTSASSEKSKAEAEIALECYEQIQKALEH